MCMHVPMHAWYVRMYVGGCVETRMESQTSSLNKWS